MLSPLYGHSRDSCNVKKACIKSINISMSISSAYFEELWKHNELPPQKDPQSHEMQDIENLFMIFINGFIQFCPKMYKKKS